MYVEYGVPCSFELSNISFYFVASITHADKLD